MYNDTPQIQPIQVELVGTHFAKHPSLISINPTVDRENQKYKYRTAMGAQINLTILY
jgi:hypothetical protein